MCNDYRRTPPMDTIRVEWSQTRMRLRFPEGFPNLARLESIRVTDPGAIVRASEEAPGEGELVVRRWSWPGANGKPVYNYRSDGREFTSGRCLIVADGFYEFTTPVVAPGVPKPKRKDKWLFTRPGEEVICIAGLWRATAEVGEAFTMLTCPPGPDIAPYHSRQVVIVDRADWGRWLDPAVPAAEICRPLPAGSLAVTKVS